MPIKIRSQINKSPLYKSGS